MQRSTRVPEKKKMQTAAPQSQPQLIAMRQVSASVTQTHQMQASSALQQAVVSQQQVELADPVPDYTITPPPKQGKHQLRWSAQGDLRTYLTEIINRQFDRDEAVRYLSSVFAQQPRTWAISNLNKKIQTALHCCSYLAEYQCDLPDTILNFVNQFLSKADSKTKKNSLEHALMILAYLVIHGKIKVVNSYVAGLENALKLLLAQCTGTTYYPALIVGILAKTMAQQELLPEESTVLQQACVSFQTLQHSPVTSFLRSVTQPVAYPSDPITYYADDPNYYKKRKKFGKKEISHVLDLLVSGKVVNELTQCRWIHALLLAVSEGQQIPDEKFAQLVQLLQPRRHRKTTFYSALLLGYLICSGRVHQDQGVLKNKLHELLSPWRGYALKAYYHHLRWLKMNQRPIELTPAWFNLVQFWAREDRAPLNQKYANLLLCERVGPSILVNLSSEPASSQASVLVLAEALDQKIQLPPQCVVLLKIILNPYSRGYSSEQRKQALLLALKLLNAAELKPLFLIPNADQKLLESFQEAVAGLVGTIKDFCETELKKVSTENNLLLLGLQSLVGFMQKGYGQDWINEVFVQQVIDFVKRLTDMTSEVEPEVIETSCYLVCELIRAVKSKSSVGLSQCTQFLSASDLTALVSQRNQKQFYVGIEILRALVEKGYALPHEVFQQLLECFATADAQLQHTILEIQVKAYQRYPQPNALLLQFLQNFDTHDQTLFASALQLLNVLIQAQQSNAVPIQIETHFLNRLLEICISPLTQAQLKMCALEILQTCSSFIQYPSTWWILLEPLLNEGAIEERTQCLQLILNQLQRFQFFKPEKGDNQEWTALLNSIIACLYEPPLIQMVLDTLKLLLQLSVELPNSLEGILVDILFTHTDVQAREKAYDLIKGQAPDQVSEKRRQALFLEDLVVSLRKSLEVEPLQQLIVYLQTGQPVTKNVFWICGELLQRAAIITISPDVHEKLAQVSQLLIQQGSEAGLAWTGSLGVLLEKEHEAYALPLARLVLSHSFDHTQSVQMLLTCLIKRVTFTADEALILQAVSHGLRALLQLQQPIDWEQVVTQLFRFYHQVTAENNDRFQKRLLHFLDELTKRNCLPQDKLELLVLIKQQNSLQDSQPVHLAHPAYLGSHQPADSQDFMHTGAVSLHATSVKTESADLAGYETQLREAFPAHATQVN